MTEAATTTIKSKDNASTHKATARIAVSDLEPATSVLAEGAPETLTLGMIYGFALSISERKGSIDPSTGMASVIIGLRGKFQCDHLKYNAETKSHTVASSVRSTLCYLPAELFEIAKSRIERNTIKAGGMEVSKANIGWIFYAHNKDGKAERSYIDVIPMSDANDSLAPIAAFFTDKIQLAAPTETPSTATLAAELEAKPARGSRRQHHEQPAA